MLIMAIYYSQGYLLYSLLIIGNVFCTASLPNLLIFNKQAVYFFEVVYLLYANIDISFF